MKSFKYYFSWCFEAMSSMADELFKGTSDCEQQLKKLFKGLENRDNWALNCKK